MHIPQPLASPQVLTNSAKSALLAQKSTLFMEKLLQSVCSQEGGEGELEAALLLYTTKSSTLE